MSRTVRFCVTYAVSRLAKQVRRPDVRVTPGHSGSVSSPFSFCFSEETFFPLKEEESVLNVGFAESDRA